MISTALILIKTDIRETLETNIEAGYCIASEKLVALLIQLDTAIKLAEEVEIELNKIS